MFPMVYGVVSQLEPVATFQVVTAGAATLTMNSLSVSAATTIDWGDSSQSTYTGTALRTHNYTEAGTWTVTIYTPKNVTVLDLRNQSIVTGDIADIAPLTSLVTLNFYNTSISGDIADIAPLTSLVALHLADTSISGDIADIAPLTSLVDLRLYNTSISGDIADIAPLTSLLTLHLGGTSISGDIADIAPLTSLVSLYLYNTSITCTSGLSSMTKLINFYAYSCGWTQAMSNAALWSLYQASVTPRDAANGIISIGGTNAAPSGTFQAATSCPVTAATPGKEIAHELLNDGCGAGFNTWATVTVTA